MFLMCMKIYAMVQSVKGFGQVCNEHTDLGQYGSYVIPSEMIPSYNYPTSLGIFFKYFDWAILLTIRSSDNGSTCYWPPGLLHTLGAGGHIWLFMWIKIICIEYILWWKLTTKSTFDVANVLKNVTVISTNYLSNHCTCILQKKWKFWQPY